MGIEDKTIAHGRLLETGWGRGWPMQVRREGGQVHVTLELPEAPA